MGGAILERTSWVRVSANLLMDSREVLSQEEREEKNSSYNRW